MALVERRFRVLEGYARPVSMAFRRPELAWAALRLVAEALRSFFGPQFENALLKRRPVVNVDHPLDETVPFEPGRVNKYLEFIKLWMSSFYRLAKLYGPKAYPLLAGYVDAIRELYAEAGAVYKTVHTTTTRPAENYNLRFAVIHATDPHLNCVPSLHVLIVVANWKLAASVVSRMRAHGLELSPAAERRLDAWLVDLRREALAITESVLFVKQHSVNCIGASFYYLRRRGPGLSEAEIWDFVRDLFGSGAGSDGLSPSGAAALRLRMLEVYAELDASFARDPARDWREPIYEFLDGFSDWRPRSSAPRRAT
jgi:hypothetical protein